MDIEAVRTGLLCREPGVAVVERHAIPAHLVAQARAKQRRGVVAVLKPGSRKHDANPAAGLKLAGRGRQGQPDDSKQGRTREPEHGENVGRALPVVKNGKRTRDRD